jgi:hypothetical protein
MFFRFINKVLDALLLPLMEGTASMPRAFTTAR